MIPRMITTLLNRRIDDRKVVSIIGPRQVGKTTLLKREFQDANTLWFNADRSDVRTIFENQNLSQIQQHIGKAKKIIIDEAQRINNIGLTLKLIHDELPDVKIIVTGSSALNLADSINEPLTGRKWEYMMYPLSWEEMASHHGQIEEQRLLEHRMIYGYYPDVINNPGDEKEILATLSDGYLYKDLLSWEDIKKPKKLEQLVQALAFQIGNEVSNNELGKIVGLDNETVERYISLLEKAFIVFTLPALSRNLRNELKKSRKVYFYDLGLRNSIIKNYNPISLRNDVGQIWENWLIVERRKHKSYQAITTNDYFWRTHAQQEIDFIEEYGGSLHAYEFKWNPKRKIRFTKTFTNAYPDHELMGVNSENYLPFIQNSLSAF